MNSLSWIELVIGSLVTFRLATMFALEKGPGKIFCKLRHAPKKAVVREGLSCPLCLGVHFATALSLIWATLGWITWVETTFAALAMSGVSVILSRSFTRDL